MSRAHPGDVDAYVEALKNQAAAFAVYPPFEAPAMGRSVAEVRRRRGRLTDDAESGLRTMRLIERDGVLLWETPEAPIAPLATVRRRGRAAGIERADTVLTEVDVPVLEPNEYLGALADTDRTLNPQLKVNAETSSKGDANLRRVKRAALGFDLEEPVQETNFKGDTLLFVHGTFASSRSMLGELAATGDGLAFMTDALARYDRVLVFDHPTLSLSPFLNGLDLARALAGTTGAIDVIAHSRGGVVTRWWLEVFGDSVSGATVRAVLAGAPLRGTSLVAPNRIVSMLSLITNIGSFVGRTLGLAAAANPFALASMALLRFVARRELNSWGLPPVDRLGERPSIDAAIAVIPGLHGQSAVSNNEELTRLRAAAARPGVRYFAITADFEPEAIGWELWRVLTEAGDRAADTVTDRIFPKENDLVVDTAHMTSLGGRDIAGADRLMFGRQGTVHHLNYFRQPDTMAHLRQWLA